MFLSNNPSSGDINSSNLPCYPGNLQYCIICKHVFSIVMENSVDPEQMASSEASWSGSTVFSKKNKSGFSTIRVKESFFPCQHQCILGNPGVTHSVPTAFINRQQKIKKNYPACNELRHVINAVGKEWVMPGLPRMTSVGITCDFPISICHKLFALCEFNSFAIFQKIPSKLCTYFMLFFLFDLIFHVPVNNFQLCQDGSSWVEPVLSKI